MAKAKDFGKIAERHKSVADFVSVYIREAHPTDGWFLKTNKYTINNHRTIEERLKAANIFKNDIQLSVPVMADNMSDDACWAYGASPERLYIIKDGLIVYVGGTGPDYYNLEEMESELIKMV